MSPRPLIAAFAALYAAAVMDAQSGYTPKDFEIAARTYLEKLAIDGLPGVCVHIARDGNIAFQAGFGLADIDKKQSVTVNTKFRIGSVTKQFTAASILHLAELKALSLTDKVEKFLPGFPRGDQITLHHLLTVEGRGSVGTI